MPDLLPAAKTLLVEILDGLSADADDLPELRVGIPGRSGARYWLYGKQRKPFPSRKPVSYFDELKSAGMLRKLRTDKSTGTYFAFTPEAFRYRDQLLVEKPPDQAHPRPSEPAPEISTARSRIDALTELATTARAGLDSLIDASAIEEKFHNDPDTAFVIVPSHPWRCRPLDPDGRNRLGVAMQGL